MSDADEAVRRVLARDSLLMMAIDADEAVGIVRQREMLAKLTQDEQSLFEAALQHHLDAAHNDPEWSVRARAWRYAGIIVRFSEMVGVPTRMPNNQTYTSAEMHDRSLRELFAEGEADQPDADPLDLTQHTFHLWRAARDLRLDGRPEDSLGLSQVNPNDVYATGAEGYLGYLMFEAAAAYLDMEQGGQVEDVLSELDEHYRTRAAGSGSRYRIDFARALANWGSTAATAALATAFKRAQWRTTADDLSRDLEQLSVTLAWAEHLAAYATSERDRAKAVLLAHRTLRLANRVQGRWRVIARSRAPLAVVFQRIYGDIALLAAGLGDRRAAELGLRVALSAKQTGFAARMRTDRRLLSPDVEDIIDSIVQVEDGPRSGLLDKNSKDELDRLRFELAEAVSPMLADTVLPVPAELDQLHERIGERYAVDYLELSDSLADTPHLFRCLVRPDRRMVFERFVPEPYFVDFFVEARRTGRLAQLLNAALAGHPAGPGRDLPPDDESLAGHVGDAAFDWLRLARELLPADLLAELARADPDNPIELLISAHSWLTLVPWPALEIVEADGRRPRMIERAVLTQTPVFTCLQHRQPPPVTGEALVRLVGKTAEEAEAKDGVDVGQERIAWGLSPGVEGVPLSRCAVAGNVPPVPFGGKLAHALSKPQRWGFAHLAAHGDGAGLSQYLRIPGETLSFGVALTLNWPESVLMASCHVGQVVNVADAEPLSLVMALLSGGARCVVAGITSVDDAGTGKIAGCIVGAIRERGVSLAVALRDAQRRAADDGEPVLNWALLGAYTQ
jgi:hypothetical protein